jgi:hypothetical protein
MSTPEDMAERAEALREAAEREPDETVALVCRGLAEVYETLAAARRHRSLHRLH